VTDQFSQPTRRTFLTGALGLACALPLRAQPALRFDLKSRRGAKGFFRVARATTGHWWLLDPAGKPFFYRGVCGINRAGTQGGRRAQPGPYAATVDRKYNYGESPQRFVAATLARLRVWNFNALGAWCTEEFFEQGMPYTEITEFSREGAMIRGAGVRLPDVFDPAWPKHIDGIAARLCAPRQKSRQLIGYFTDNELGWGQPQTDAIWGAPEQMNLKGPMLLQVCLTLPPDRAARRAAWEFVLARHGNDLGQVGQAWGVALRDRAELTRLTDAKQILTSAGYGADHDAFSRAFARRYFQLTAEAIRRHDPNHLILGCRFGAPPNGLILDECRAPFVDVLSANNYRVDMYGRMNSYYRARQMPILIGEFSWASPPFTDPKQLPEAYRNDALRHVREIGVQALERAAQHPGVVGYTWYRWVQKAQGAFSYGLVNENDEPHALNTELLTAVNARLETIAARETLLPERN
jgi:hypothetical protein